jgi:tRNA-intron endonuclease
MEKITGFLMDTRVIIPDIEDGHRIWSLGYYGKPMGISKPKAPTFNKPLLLDLIEAIYLMKKGILRVKALTTNEDLEVDDIIKYAKKSYERFEEKYLVYEDLRNRGYIVISGLKFGTDFAVYEKGPGLEHAPYIVDVLNIKSIINTDELIRAGRLATSVRKRFIIAIPNIVTGDVKYLVFKWWKP